MKQILYLSLMYAAIIQTAQQEPVSITTSAEHKESTTTSIHLTDETLHKARQARLELEVSMAKSKTHSSIFFSHLEEAQRFAENRINRQHSKIKELKTENKTLQTRIKALETQVLALQSQSTLDTTTQTPSTIEPENNFPYLKLLFDSSTTANS